MVGGRADGIDDGAGTMTTILAMGTQAEAVHGRLTPRNRSPSRGF